MAGERGRERKKKRGGGRVVEKRREKSGPRDQDRRGPLRAASHAREGQGAGQERRRDAVDLDRARQEKTPQEEVDDRVREGREDAFGGGDAQDHGSRRERKRHDGRRGHLEKPGGDRGDDEPRKTLGFRAKAGVAQEKVNEEAQSDGDQGAEDPGARSFGLVGARGQGAHADPPKPSEGVADRLRRRAWRDRRDAGPRRARLPRA